MFVNDAIRGNFVARHQRPAKASDAKTLGEVTVQPPKYTCQFGAPDLLRRRRLISQDMTIDAVNAAELIRDIDQARWHHFEDTGCSCWEDAIKASPSAFAKSEAA